MIPLLIRFHRPLIGLALILALMWALNTYVADAVADDRAESRVEALEADSKADDAAGQVAASQVATVEKGNDDAREAANAGSDPLGDGLRKLRTGKAGGATAPARPADVQR